MQIEWKASCSRQHQLPLSGEQIVDLIGSIVGRVGDDGRDRDPLTTFLQRDVHLRELILAEELEKQIRTDFVNMEGESVAGGSGVEHLVEFRSIARVQLYRQRRSEIRIVALDAC